MVIWWSSRFEPAVGWLGPRPPGAGANRGVHNQRRVVVAHSSPRESTALSVHTCQRRAQPGRLLMIAALFLAGGAGAFPPSTLAVSPAAACHVGRCMQDVSMSASMFESGEEDEDNRFVDEANDLNWLHTKLQLALAR